MSCTSSRSSSTTKISVFSQFILSPVGAVSGHHLTTGGLTLQPVCKAIWWQLLCVFWGVEALEERFGIGELARRTGYSAGMIRHFERLGVISLSDRTAAGYRVFGPQHVKELQFVREMQDLGFYARQIKAMREIKSSGLSADDKVAAIERVFREHVRYVDEKQVYFSNLQVRLRQAAPDFAKRVLGSDDPPNNG